MVAPDRRSAAVLRRSAPRRRATSLPRRALAAACAIALAACAPPAGTAGEGPDRGPSRTTVPLDGTWTLHLDPDAVGRAAGWAEHLSAGRVPPGATSAPLPIAVPGALEGTPETALVDLEAMTGYDGVVWYVRRFTAPADVDGALLRLRFEQVDYLCEAWLDGQPVGQHEGGYDAFALDVTGRLRAGAEHVLVVMVLDVGATETLGLTLATTPHAKESWYHDWGGLLGSVTLHVDRVPVVERLFVEPDPTSGAVSWRAELAAPPGLDTDAFALRVEVREVPEASEVRGAVVASADGIAVTWQGPRAAAEGALTVPAPRPWSPESPRLYALDVVGAALPGAAGAGDASPSLLERPVRFGFRSVAFRDGDVVLNGTARRLAGVLYQPHFTGTGGVTPGAAELEQTVLDMKACGFDLVRAHVRPAPPAFLDACDRHGLLVLEEPAIGWVGDDAGLLARLRREIDWMVERDRHHPSIVIWGVLNEMSGKGYRYAEDLARRLAWLDPTRPVLVDSGGFLDGGRYAPARGLAGDGEARLGPAALMPSGSMPSALSSAMPYDDVPLLAMHDEHVYPPYPLPLAAREHMRMLGARSPGPVFVSEFGYGTVLDTARAFAGYRARGVRDEEFALFKSYDGNARRARESGAAWRDASWHPEGHRVQADAAEDMLEALRANPAVDLLCYTQWQAVSAEPSAGVLAPWGEARPVRDRIRHALRPIMLALFPDRLAVRDDEPIACDVVVVNDTGAPVRAAVRVRFTVTRLGERDDPGRDPVEVELGEHELRPGITSLRATLEPHPDRRVPATDPLHLVVQVDAVLQRDGTIVERATPRTVHVLGHVSTGPDHFGPGSIQERVGSTTDVARGERVPLSMWAPAADEHARDVLERLGIRRATRPRDATGGLLLARPERLEGTVPLAEQLELWRLVRQGGVAVVQLPDPVVDDVARLLGMGRGVLALPSLPVTLPVARAAGNFMGRLHLARRSGPLGDVFAPSGAGGNGPPPAPLGRGDESLSPVAMLRGPLPEGSTPSMLTLSHTGTPLGWPLVAVPFGEGWIHCVGLPLVGEGAGEPRQRNALWRIVSSAARGAAYEWVQRHGDDPWPPDWTPPDPAQLAELERALDRIAAYAELCERASPFVMGPRAVELPGELRTVLDAKNAALAQVLDGAADAGVAALRTLADGLWSDELERFLALEGEVRAGFGRLVERGEAAPHDAHGAPGATGTMAAPGTSAAPAARSLATTARAHDVLEQWAEGLVAWFAGRRDAARQSMGRAALLLERDPDEEG